MRTKLCQGDKGASIERGRHVGPCKGHCHRTVGRNAEQSADNLNHRGRYRVSEKVVGPEKSVFIGNTTLGKAQMLRP